MVKGLTEPLVKMAVLMLLCMTIHRQTQPLVKMAVLMLLCSDNPQTDPAPGKDGQVDVALQ